MFKKYLILFIFNSILFAANAQYNYRINANILTKTRLPDSTFQISKGTIHYDQNIKKIIFDFSFPEKEKVVLFDTLMFRFRKDTLVEKSKNFLIPEQSFFHFILSGNLSNFGFDDANFEAKGIEKKKDMIITTWLPPETLEKYISKVLVASKNKLLYSITLIDADGEVLNRQILKNYHLIDGISIPYEVLIATYMNGSTMYQVITLDNVILNEVDNNEAYDYEL